MGRPKAIALIELLVAMAVIALLMAVLMPAMQGVKTQAKAVACRSSLHWWAVIFEMYAGQNDRHFWSGDYSRDGWHQYDRCERFTKPRDDLECHDLTFSTATSCSSTPSRDVGGLSSSRTHPAR